jgi:hypothetical protein
MDAKAVSKSVNNVIKTIEKTIGPRLTSRLVSRSLEKVKSKYEYIENIEISKNRVNFKFKRKISEKEEFEVLIAALSEIELSYSKIVGPVGRTAFKEGLNSFIEATKDKTKKVKKG